MVPPGPRIVCGVADEVRMAIPDNAELAGRCLQPPMTAMCGRAGDSAHPLSLLVWAVPGGRAVVFGTPTHGHSACGADALGGVRPLTSADMPRIASVE